MHTARSGRARRAPIAAPSAVLVTLLCCAGAGGNAAAAPTAAPSAAPEARADRTPAPPSTPREGAPGTADQALRAALDAPHRAEPRRQRDRYLHPDETLRFFGVRAEQFIVELWPALGWYAEILAPYVADGGGRYRAVNYFPFDQRPPAAFERAAVIMQIRVDAERYELRDMELTGYQTSMDAPLAPVPLERIAPHGSVDRILTFDDAQRWFALGILDDVLAVAWDALAPDGLLGVVAPRAPDDWDAQRMIANGYLSEQTLLAHAARAGFALDARSDVNANPRDTHDWPAGAWTLPPHLRLGEKDQERYLAVGEPDRFTLRLRKREP